ncbi:MAG: type II secretion system F family protein [Pirellulaceae bacterium]|jgi:tight adherence protein B|nr:type II secretion system F family protein [Pirellulaceae bacterium]MDP7019657.1 type II secretion system F family protein [Pirellulaceae bacterium]
MDPSLIIIACFAAGSLLVAAVLFVVRDLFFVAASGGGSVLGRLPLARDERPPDGVIETIDHKLARLVVETGMDATPMGTVLLMIATGLALGGGFFLVTENEIGGAVGFAVGALAPLPILIMRRARRLKQIQEQLPDVLDLLARAVRAGESLDQAIDLAGRKTSEPLAREFRRCSNQLKMGLALSAAMRSLAYRVQVMEMRILATTLSVHRQAGGNLGETLDRMAHVVRERLTYRRQLRVATAAGRFSAALVSIAGVLLFCYMFVFQADYTHRLLSTPIGQSLLVLALVLEIVGLLWIWRLLRSEY